MTARQQAPAPNPGQNIPSNVPLRLVDRATDLIVGAYIVVTAVSPYMYGSYLAIPLVGVLLWHLAVTRIPTIGLLWAIGLGLLGSSGILIGLFNENPGAIPTATVYIVEPLIFGSLFSALVATANWTRRVRFYLDLALLAVAGVGIAVYYANVNSTFVIPSWLVDPTWSYADLNGSTIRTNYQGYNSLIFLAPYGIARAFEQGSGSQRLWGAVLLAASLSGLILSGRRILYITVPVALAIAWIATKLLSRSRSVQIAQSKPLSPLVAPVAAIGVAAAIFLLLKSIGLSIGEAFGRIATQFTVGDQTDLRYGQDQFLIGAWMEKPIFGHGAGAVIDGYARSAETPWAFELSYHTLLFNFGVLGFFILLAWGAWIALNLARGIGTVGSFAAVTLAAFLSTAMATYVDPYIQKFDGMWMVFVPFAVATAAYACRTVPTDSPLTKATS